MNLVICTQKHTHSRRSTTNSTVLRSLLSLSLNQFWSWHHFNFHITNIYFQPPSFMTLPSLSSRQGAQHAAAAQAQFTPVGAWQRGQQQQPLPHAVPVSPAQHCVVDGSQLEFPALQAAQAASFVLHIFISIWWQSAFTPIPNAPDNRPTQATSHTGAASVVRRQAGAQKAANNGMLAVVATSPKVGQTLSLAVFRALSVHNKAKRWHEGHCWKHDAVPAQLLVCSKLLLFLGFGKISYISTSRVRLL